MIMSELKRLLAKKEKANEALKSSPEQMAFKAAEKALIDFLIPLKNKAKAKAKAGKPSGNFTDNGFSYNYLVTVTPVSDTRTTVKVTART